MSLYLIKKNQVITMTRGDSFSFSVELKTGKFPNIERYILEEGDILLFGLMRPNQHFECAFIKKEYGYEGGTLKVTLQPEDTIDLEPGVYYYQIKMLYKDEAGEVHVDTVVQKTKFIIVD